MKKPRKDQTERLSPSPVSLFEDETVISTSRSLRLGSNDTFGDTDDSVEIEDLDAKSFDEVMDELTLTGLRGSELRGSELRGSELRDSDERTKPLELPPEDAYRPIGGVAPTRVLELPDGGDPGGTAELELGPEHGSRPERAPEVTGSAPLLAPPQELERTLAELGVLLKYGHEGQVRQLLERLKRAYPEDAHMHDRLADFHLAHDQKEEAVAACFAAARASFEQRRIPGFQAALERVLRIDPENARARKLLRLIRKPR